MKADGAAGVDLIVRNARIFTVDTERPWATALAVHDGRFSFVGDDEGLSAHRGSATEILDAGGALVVPGLIDSHTHAYEGGRAAHRTGHVAASYTHLRLQTICGVALSVVAPSL